MKWNKLLICIFYFLVSCEEPIILDLPSGDPFTIIDANISESKVISRVILSKSLNFNDTINFPPIENASIVLSNGDASFSYNYVTSLEVGAIYESMTDVTLNTDDGYSFSVYLPGSLVDPDTLYQAYMKMPTKVPIDSLKFKASNQVASEYILRIFFTDPEAERNYYSWRISRKVNGQFVLETSNKIPLYTDQGIDGKAVFVEYTNNNFSASDTIQVHFKSLTRDAYDYYRSLNNLIDVTGTNTSSDNPRSNFQSSAGDDAFGFFSLEATDDSEIIAVVDSLNL